MPAGFQTWDASGNLIVDTTTLLGRIIGSVSIVGTSGSITDARFANGTPFAFPVMGYSNAFSAFSLDASRSAPAVSFSGTTLNWTRGAEGAGAEVPSCTLYYGVT